jgi:hypothetical protein
MEGGPLYGDLETDRWFSAARGSGAFPVGDSYFRDPDVAHQRGGGSVLQNNPSRRSKCPTVPTPPNLPHHAVNLHSHANTRALRDLAPAAARDRIPAGIDGSGCFDDVRGPERGGQCPWHSLRQKRLSLPCTFLAVLAASCEPPFAVLVMRLSSPEQPKTQLTT